MVKLSFLLRFSGLNMKKDRSCIVQKKFMVAIYALLIGVCFFPFSIQGEHISHEINVTNAKIINEDHYLAGVDSEVLFNCSVYQGDIINFTWDFGDGSTAIQPDTDHKYSDKGSFYTTLTVTDNDGNQDAVTKIITIKNLSPTADFTVSSTEVEIDETVQFTDKSSDPEEKTLQYQWEFGDGLSSTQRNPQHDYSEPGQYTVELTVTDDERASNTKSIMIEVEETQDGDGFRIPGFPYASIALAIILVVITLGFFKKNSFL